MHNILICDDERDIVNALVRFFKSEGYNTFAAYSGSEALEIIQKETIDLVLLDIMMPGIDGLETLELIRADYDMPILFISAKSEDTDIILGLNIGADDYITKPFNMMEVAARVRSHLRRYEMYDNHTKQLSTLTIGGITLDDDAKEVFVDGDLINLTPTEFDILKMLMQSPGKVFSAKEIYQKIWKGNSFSIENTIAVHIRHLREKIEITPSEPRYIKVVWGQGYKIGGDKK